MRSTYIRPLAGSYTTVAASRRPSSRWAVDAEMVTANARAGQLGPVAAAPLRQEAAGGTDGGWVAAAVVAPAGAWRRWRLLVVFVVHSQDKVLQRFVEQIIDGTVGLDTVQQRFVEQNRAAWVWWRRSPTSSSSSHCLA